MTLVLRARNPVFSSGGGNFTGANGFSSSDTWTPGATVTLSKSGGGLGAGPTIEVFADFWGGTDGADIPLAAAIVGALDDYGPNGIAPKYASGGMHGGTCARVTAASPGNDASLAYQFENLLPAGTRSFYAYYGLKADITKIDNVKEIWFLGESSQGNGTSFNDTCLSHNGAGQYPYVFGNQNGSDWYFGDVNSSPAIRQNWIANAWHVREWSIDIDAGNLGSHGLIYCSHRHASHFSQATVRSDAIVPTPQGCFDTNPGEWRAVTLPGYFSYADSGGPFSALYFGPLYLAIGANNKKRVMLTRSPTWTAGGLSYIAAPVTFSDGSIGLRLPRVPEGTLSGYYAHVFDAANVATYGGSIA